LHATAAVSHDPPIPHDDARVQHALQAALHHARDRAAYADILFERVFKAEANLLGSGQVLLKPASLQGAAQVRLVDDAGRHVGVRVGSVEPESLRAAVDTAAEALAAEAPSPEYGLAPVPNAQRTRYGLALHEDPRTVDPTPRLAALVRAVQSLSAEGLGARPGVRVVPELWAWTQVEEKWIADTDGMRKTQVLPVSFVQVVFRAVRGDAQARTRVRFGDLVGLSALVHDDGSLAPAMAASLAEHRDRAVALLDARPLTESERVQLTHYILHQSALVFVHEGLGHPIEADIVRAGSSAIVAPDGTARVTPLGSSVVRIVDGPAPAPDGSPLAHEGFGTELIDDEGVEVQNTVLVDGGYIVGMMHSRETAHRYGVAPTGNGFSELGDRRIVRMRNTTLCPTPGAHWVDTLEALVRDVPLGVVLFGSLGGAVSKDGMSSSTQYGLLVRDGRVTDTLIAPGNFTALTLGCLQTVEGYAGPVAADGLGFCGKNGQSRRVTDGGPAYVKLGVSPHLTLTFEGS